MKINFHTKTITVIVILMVVIASAIFLALPSELRKNLYDSLFPTYTEKDIVMVCKKD